MGRENLERVMAAATDWDVKVAGAAWFRYQKIVGDIATRHGFPLSIGVAVFAALSPNNDYLGNLRDVNRMLAAARNRTGIDSFKVSTYGNNKRKAWRIVQGEQPLDLIVFPKTRSFYLNIMDPTDPRPVTVDGHIYNAWMGKRIPLNSAATKFRVSMYDSVAESIRQIGADRGLVPNVVQGIIWFAWKRMHTILHSDQLEFWEPDYLAAGLGFELDNQLKVN